VDEEEGHREPVDDDVVFRFELVLFVVAVDEALLVDKEDDESMLVGLFMVLNK
jgi:hypothetical protein